MISTKQVRFSLLIFLFSLSTNLVAQPDLESLLDDSDDEDELVTSTFKSTRLILAHTTRSIKENNLDVRITHRFDDILGPAGGIHSFFGLDYVADVRIAFEYGVTDRIDIGFGRSKGASKVKENLDGFVKLHLLRQTLSNKMPVSLSVLLNSSVSIMQASTDSTSIAFFEKPAHRLSYVTQVIVARKFSDRLSLMLLPTYVHRNFVEFDDENGFIALGAGGRIKLTKRTAIVADYFYILSDLRQTNKNVYFNPLGIGFEIETGGHVFHMNFSNSRGIIENQYLPYTTSSWLSGEFRLGFNISRMFAL
ncbi:MAG: hypothetical protein IIA45_13220 [Bacteroidetes bacterium]|nr:hypothetical protein [Bacteroidota bacterium]